MQTQLRVASGAYRHNAIPFGECAHAPGPMFFSCLFGAFRCNTLSLDGFIEARVAFVASTDDLHCTKTDE